MKRKSPAQSPVKLPAPVFPEKRKEDGGSAGLALNSHPSSEESSPNSSIADKVKEAIRNFQDNTASLEPTLDEVYRQEYEHSKKNWQSVAMEDRVCYLGVEESDDFKARLGDTHYSKSSIYVFAPTGELFVPYKGSGKPFIKVNGKQLKHSSITHREEPKDSKSVICAGEIRINGGKISYINNSSGHFKPSPLNLYIALEALKSHVNENAKVGIVTDYNCGDAVVTKMPVSDFRQIMEKLLPDLSKEKQLEIENKIDGLKGKMAQANEAIAAEPEEKRARLSLISSSEGKDNETLSENTPPNTPDRWQTNVGRKGSPITPSHDSPENDGGFSNKAVRATTRLHRSLF